MDRLRGRNVVLDDVPQLDGRKRVAVLDTRLDVDKTLAHRVVALNGIGQKVFQHLAGITVLKKVYSICHCRMSLLVLQ